MTQDKEEYSLDKNVWTQDDFEQMGWHDCRIYGLTISPTDKLWSTDLIFDIDYVFKWVKPILPESTFSFWIAPCTLIFKETFSLKVDIDMDEMVTDLLEIDDLKLIDKVEKKKGVCIYKWKIELQRGVISFESLGFNQIVRHKPMFSNQQVLTLEERGEINFGLRPYDL